MRAGKLRMSPGKIERLHAATVACIFRVTPGNVWIRCGQRKLKMNSRRLLRDHREGSRNTFTVGNGHHPGATPGHGNGRETGCSRGRLVPAGGARCRGSRATGRSGAARPDKAPFISYMKGALLYSAGPRRSTPDRHAGKCQHVRQIMRPNGPGSTASVAASSGRPVRSA